MGGQIRPEGFEDFRVNFAKVSFHAANGSHSEEIQANHGTDFQPGCSKLLVAGAQDDVETGFLLV